MTGECGACDNCPGLLLANCPSPAAETLRHDIRQALDAGLTREAIEANLYERFGDRIRSMPRAAGVGRLAWIVPSAMLSATALWLLLWLRRIAHAARTRVAPAASAPLPAALRDRLDEELSRL